MSPRESADSKGARYLTEARLRVLQVDEDGGTVAAECRGDGRAYSLGFDDARLVLQLPGSRPVLPFAGIGARGRHGAPPMTTPAARTETERVFLRLLRGEDPNRVWTIRKRKRQKRATTSPRQNGRGLSAPEDVHSVRDGSTLDG